MPIAHLDTPIPHKLYPIGLPLSVQTELPTVGQNRGPGRARWYRADDVCPDQARYRRRRSRPAREPSRRATRSSSRSL
jgi:hypothetical protein